VGREAVGVGGEEGAGEGEGAGPFLREGAGPSLSEGGVGGAEDRSEERIDDGWEVGRYHCEQGRSRNARAGGSNVRMARKWQWHRGRSRMGKGRDAFFLPISQAVGRNGGEETFPPPQSKNLNVDPKTRNKMSIDLLILFFHFF
jgi:hypothetical protein